MAIIDLYIDYGIETAPEGHKHCIDGWVNITCPHCTGSEGYHLGFNIGGAYYSCWRCGTHSINYTLAKLLQVHPKQAKQIGKEYKVFRKNAGGINNLSIDVKIGQKKFKYPSGVYELSKPHRRYLKKRHFDPDQLVKDWGLLGTSPTSGLKSKEGGFIFYKFRILVPIIWEDQIVTYQCRDYTDRQALKYMACPQEREIIHHKHILYGHPDLWEKRIGIVVEGVFDVWRLGRSACATLGVGFTSEQVKTLARLFDKIFIVFDPEKQANLQAKKLQEELQFRGVESYVYTDLETDPGAMSNDDARYLLKELKLAP